MSARIEGGLLLATGVILGAGLVQMQSCGREPAPREERREERRAEISAPLPQPALVVPPPALPPVPTAQGVVIERPAMIEKPVIQKPVVEKPVAQKPVVQKPVVQKPVVQKQVTARNLKIAGTRLNRVPSSVLARLRRGNPGLSKALAYELARGTRALERGTAYTAYSHFLQALKYDAKSSDALMGIALCHYELEQKGATRRALAKVFALDATHPEASILSGFIAQLAHDSGAAVEWYQRALGRIEDAEVAGELRSVISQLQAPSSESPTATAFSK